MITQPIHALLIDQDSTRADLWSHWLAEKEFVVSLAQDRAEAVQMIERDCPHMLVIHQGASNDVMDLCHWVRNRDLPNYVYTMVVSDSLTTVQALQAGADTFLPSDVEKHQVHAWLDTSCRVIHLEQRLSILANHDPLTGLPSQRRMAEMMEREWSRAIEFRLPLTCAMIDLDFFKRVNDTYGHGVGDRVIQAVAEVLHDECRTTDMVSRYGGEEFCVLLPETTEESALAWAECVRERIAALSVEHEEKAIRVTASIGIASRLDDTKSPSQLIDLADQALLVAKHSGRDRVVSFTTIDKSGGSKSATAYGPGVVFRGLKAKDVMTTIVAGLNVCDDVWSAAQFFQQFRITSAPITDTTGKLVGILSEKDLMSIMIWPDWRQTKICDVMKTNVVWYDENAPVLAIYEFLCRVSIRSVVIMLDGRPTGVVSRTSLLRWVSNSELALEHHASANVHTIDEEDTCERLSATVVDLIRQANMVEQHMDSEPHEFVSCVVGGASRIQELANDLLALAGAMNRHRPAADLPTKKAIAHKSQDDPSTASLGSFTAYLASQTVPGDS